MHTYFFLRRIYLTCRVFKKGQFSSFLAEQFVLMLVCLLEVMISKLALSDSGSLGASNVILHVIYYTSSKCNEVHKANVTDS
jgi:hypothetical protein